MINYVVSNNLILTTMNIQEKIQHTINHKTEQLNLQITNSQNYLNNLNKHLEKLQATLPALTKSLLKQNLQIVDVTYSKTGNIHNENIWDDKDCLAVTLKCISNNNKFKFISFKGYDSSGAGKNRKQLVTKAHKIQDTIFSETGVKINVNEFSLQYGDFKRNEDLTTKRVIIESWIKM